MTVPRPALACTGASIKNDVVCILLYWCLYWSVFVLVLVFIELYWDSIGPTIGECIFVTVLGKC